MKINTIYRHPAELEAEAMLFRKQPYPDSFSLAPRLDDEQAVVVHCWLDKVLAIVDIARIDAEANS